MKILLGLLAFLLFCASAAVEIFAQKAHPPAPDPCKDAYFKGYTEGGKAFGNLQLVLSSTELAEKAGPIPIQILVENISGSDAYRFATAEVIRTHFSETLKIEPRAALVLHISGTQLAGSTDDLSKTIEVSVYAIVQHRFLTGKEEPHLVIGAFEFASDGVNLVNFSSAATSQVVREKVYKVLSDFLKKWNESKVDQE